MIEILVGSNLNLTGRGFARGLANKHDKQKKKKKNLKTYPSVIEDEKQFLLYKNLFGHINHQSN